MMETKNSPEISLKKSKEELFKKPKVKKNCKPSSDVNDNSEEQCNLCIVGQMLLYPFSQRNSVEKTVIVARGRCTPNLKCMLKENTNILIKETIKRWYNEYTWLTCCEHKNKLFCWICLLFARTLHPSWCKVGFDDLERFHICARRHENSRGHIQSVIIMKKFQQTRLSKEYPNSKNIDDESANIDISNLFETVENQRLLIMKKLIDINCMDLIESNSRCKKLNMKHKKSYGANNQAQCSAYYRSSDIYGRITNSLYNLMYCRIKLEIETSPFFSVILNNITDVSQKSINTVVFRYLTLDGKVRERLLKVSQCSGKPSENILTKIDEWLENMNAKGKIVALSYDGASIPIFQNGALKQIQNKYGILITHCHSHRLNTVLQQSVEKLPACRDFFQTVTKLRLFFSQSKRRKQAYFKAMGVTFLPKTSLTSLVTEQILEDISENNSEFMTLLQVMSSDKDIWDGSTRIEARGFYETLKEFDFIFMLKVFSDIQLRAELLHRSLNSSIFTNQEFCSETISAYINHLKGLVDKFDTIWDSLFTDEQGSKEPVKKKRKKVQQIKFNEKDPEPYRKLYFDIIDTVSRQVIQRYSGFSHLKFVSLLNIAEFDQYADSFPEEPFNCLSSAFHCFDLDRLKDQLIEIYNLELRKTSLAELYQYLVTLPDSHNIDQVTKLSALILALPISKIRGSSSVSKINSYLINSGRRLGKKALIVVEKDLLKQLWGQSGFYNTLCLTALPNLVDFSKY